MKLLKFLRRTAPPAPPPPEVDLDDWRVVTVRNEENRHSVVMRVRFSKPARPDVATLATAIVIRWPYDSELPMPPQAVRDGQAEFERALDPLAPSENSELVHVATGMGLKEWIFYARDRDAFMARFNDLLAGHPEYPVAIEFYDDPEWRVWGQMIEGLEERGE